MVNNLFNHRHNLFNAFIVMLILCCCRFFIGCRFSDKCAIHNASYLVEGNKKRKHSHGLQIMHYSRSLEKFALKSKTWVTATGENGASSNNYHLGHFLERQVGTTFDNRAATR